MDDSQLAEKKDELKLSFASPDQHQYFNGYSMAIGAGDVIITLLLQGKPILTLNTSYTVAKTLAKALTNSIDDLEKITKNHIMTVDEVHTAIQNSTDRKE